MDPFSAVLGEVDIVVALAELRARAVREEPEVGKRGRIPTERFVEGDVFGRGDEPFLTCQPWSRG